MLNSAFLSVIERGSSEKAVVGMNQVMAQLHLETGYVYVLYGEVQKAKMHFEKANETIGFRIEWTGLCYFHFYYFFICSSINYYFLYCRSDG